MARRKPSPTVDVEEPAPAVARGATARPAVARSAAAATPQATAGRRRSTAVVAAPTAAETETAPAESPTVEPPASETAQPAAGGRVERSRAGSLWIGAIALAILVILLVIFIAQNSQRVTIHFLGLHGHFSLAIALLVALVGGVLVVAIPGSVRILQLRRAVRKSAARV